MFIVNLNKAYLALRLARGDSGKTAPRVSDRARERLQPKKQRFECLAGRMTVTKSVKRDRFGTLMVPPDGADTPATGGRAGGVI